MKTSFLNCIGGDAQCVGPGVGLERIQNTHIRHLYSNGNGGRPAYNRAVIVAQMLKANGVVNLLQKRDWPEYVEPMRALDEPEELQAQFAACTTEWRMLQELLEKPWSCVRARLQSCRKRFKMNPGFSP
jgi:hypothetical protein